MNDDAAHTAGPDLLLASRSPRRRELLRQVGLEYALIDVSVDESPRPGEPPRCYVERMALAKAVAGLRAAGPGTTLPVLGADTAVVAAGSILGKPVDAADAVRQLLALSGRSHEVLSAVAVANDPPSVVTVASTVWFRPLSRVECEAYSATGEPLDKAGSYAIQGLGAAFVQRIEGSYSGVMGLPLFETCALLRERGVAVL